MAVGWAKRSVGTARRARLGPPYRLSEPHHCPVQIIRIGAFDLHRREFADPQRAARDDVDGAVDLRRVALAAALGDGGAELVDQHLLAGADPALEALGRNRLLALHEAVPALLLDFVEDGGLG